MGKALVTFDLDDTLYMERDFVRSAQRAIAQMLSDRTGLPYEVLLEPQFRAPDCAAGFDALYDLLLARGYGDTATPRTMVDIYRRHRPVALPFAPGAEALLGGLKERGHALAIVTDGRIATQTAKIQALRLRRFIAPDDIHISEATGADKHSPTPFVNAALRHPGVDRRIYIGDNPEKDFTQPRALGWTTIGLRHRPGACIHPQDFEGCPPASRPHHIIGSLTEALPLIDSLWTAC